VAAARWILRGKSDQLAGEVISRGPSIGIRAPTGRHADWEWLATHQRQVATAGPSVPHDSRSANFCAPPPSASDEPAFGSRSFMSRSPEW